MRFLVGLTLLVALVSANDKIDKAVMLDLTSKEKQWLKDHPVVRYSEVNWKPLSIIENNRMSGMMGDFLALVSQRSGITFEYVASTSWPHVLKQFSDKKIDLVPGVGSSPQETRLGLISKRYAKYPMVIVTNKSYNYLNSLADLQGKTVAVPKHYTSYNFIVKNHPDMKLKTTSTIAQALQLVQSGQADAFVGHIATSLYYLSELNLEDLKVAGRTAFEFEHHYLIQNDAPELLSIVNKAFDSITEAERIQIYGRWIQTRAVKKEDYTLVLQVGIGLLIIMAIIMYRQRTLQQYNRSLEEQKQLFDLVSENSASGVLMLDTDTRRFVECNNQILKILKYDTKEDVLNMHPSQLSPEFQPDGRRSDEKAEEMMAKAVQEGSNTFEWMHVRSDGEEFWADIILTSVVMNERHLIHVVWKDIDKRKKAEAELRASEQRNKELKERMELALIGNNDGLFDWDIETDAIYFSPRWKEMLGFEDAELENAFSTWEQRVHPDDLQVVLEAVRQCLEGKSENFEQIQRMRHKDGHWIWISSRGKPVRDDQGKAIRMIGTHTDITEDKEMQLQFFKQAQIIRQIHDAVISTDLNGYVTSWNKGAERLLGLTADKALGEHIKTLYRDEEKHLFEDHRIEVLKHEELHTTTRFVKVFGDVIYVDLSLSLMKDEMGEPVGIIAYFQDITERKKTEKELDEQRKILDYQAHHDGLTGLPNRVLFSDRLKQGIKKAKRNGTQLALFFLDLDRFKEINDSLGHEIGDNVLKVVTGRIKDKIRQEDTFARLGGDEFTLIIENLLDVNDASRLAQKILDVLSLPVWMDEKNLYVTGSIGISLYPRDGTDASSLLKYADTAMYKAKDEGRDNYQFYASEMTDLAVERVMLESQLRKALEHEEFIVYYQPQIDVLTQKLVGMEALVRWEHPDQGLISPDRFLHLAEETGLIIAIDAWVMKTAMKQVVSWYEAGLNPGVLSLNLAIKQFGQKDFVQQLSHTINEVGMQTSWLEFEVTEGQLLKHPEHAIAVLQQMSDLGMGLSVDDFGTGYSSLSYLKRLPIDKLKIDKSFVDGLPDDEEDVTITSAVIALAQSLNLKLIAEGVETQRQSDFLVAKGCHVIQGYLYAKPMKAEDIELQFLRKK